MTAYMLTAHIGIYVLQITPSPLIGLALALLLISGIATPQKVTLACGF